MTGQRPAAAQLLDRDVSEDYLREWTVHVAAEENVIQVGTKSIVIFRVGTELLALPTKVFQEVADHSAIHTLPHRRGGILNGLVSVRGELLLCAALEVLLGLEKAPEGEGTGRRDSYSRLLVCSGKGGRFAFPVTEIYGVHRYNPKDLRDVPATLKAAAGTYTIGMVQWKDKIVGCLDDELLFRGLNKGLGRMNES
jgi:chemotaxis-related protein WspD